MMGFNPVATILNAAAGGGNPMDIALKLLGPSPQMQQAAQLINGKNAQQLQTTAINMAQQRGIDINALARNLGIKMR